MPGRKIDHRRACSAISRSGELQRDTGRWSVNPLANESFCPMNAQLLIHVVDDDPGIRKSLLVLLESSGHLPRAYESAEQFLDEADLDQPGCLLLDLQMRGMGGIELLQRLRASGVEMPVILISAHADVPTAVGGMKLGAIDLLQKPFEPHALVEAVRRAIHRSTELHHGRAEQEAIRRRLADLTPRELDLLKLVVAGRSNKQIAGDLNISIKTVANHRASLMAKTGALNAADLTRLSMMAGIPHDAIRA
jgi:FixJ family two-component response regulator